MPMYDRIKALCKQKGVTITGTEKELGFARGSLCKVDTNKPSMERVNKLADYFGVTVDYLMTGETPAEKKEVTLTPRDERDIAKDLDRIMGEIKKGNNGPLYYNGVEISDASVGLLQNAIEYALRETKKENKVKYNPHKNKK